MEIKEMTALTLGRAIKSREAGVREAVKASLDQIGKVDSTLHAFLETDEKKIYDRVKEVESGIKTGKYTGPLAGVPVAVKDNICTRDRKTTCASRILENFVPPYDAEAVRRMENAALPEIPGIRKKYQVVRQEAPAQRWQRMKCLPHWEVTQAVLSVSRLLTAVWWE